MLKKFGFVISFMLLTTVSYEQSIDSLKLNETEIPGGYTKSNELICKTPHSYSFYTQINLYETFLGKVVKKILNRLKKRR